MTISIDTLKEYESKGLIKSQTHPEADLIIWNYAQEVQFDPSLWDDVTKMCRGLITNSSGDVIERPFNKFFNHNDKYLEQIGEKFDLDFEDATIQSKADGSLAILYWLNDEPFIATRGSFISDQSTEGSKMLKEVWQRQKSIGVGCPIFLRRELTHLFEIIYPENRIVVNYGQDRKLIYLCSIDKETGKTIILDNISFDKVDFYTAEEFKYIMENQPEGTIMEGFVVTFKNGHRLKFKLEDYKRLHYIMTNFNDWDIWKILKDGKDLAEELKDIPDEYYERIKEYANKLRNRFSFRDGYVNGVYIRVIDLPTRKAQAQEVFKAIDESKIDKGISAAIFKMIDNKDYQPLIWDSLEPKSHRTFLVDYGDF